MRELPLSRERDALVRGVTATKSAWRTKTLGLNQDMIYLQIRLLVLPDHRSPALSVWWGTADHFGSSKRIVREEIGQGLSNEALSFSPRPFGLVFVCILFLCSNCVLRGSV